MLAAGATAATTLGVALLRRLHSRGCELERQLSMARCELEAKQGQLSRAQSELEARDWRLAEAEEQLRAREGRLAEAQQELASTRWVMLLAGGVLRDRPLRHVAPLAAGKPGSA